MTGWAACSAWNLNLRASACAYQELRHLPRGHKNAVLTAARPTVLSHEAQEGPQCPPHTLLHFLKRPGPLKASLLVLKEEGRPGKGGRAEAAFSEDRVTLTKPSLLLSLHFDGQAKIS